MSWADEEKGALVQMQFAAQVQYCRERLGFRQIEDRGVYLFMEWRMGQAS